MKIINYGMYAISNTLTAARVAQPTKHVCHCTGSPHLHIAISQCSPAVTSSNFSEFLEVLLNRLSNGMYYPVRVNRIKVLIKSYKSN